MPPEPQAPLEPEVARAKGRWLPERRASLACAVLGVASLIAMIVVQGISGSLVTLPPLAWTTPPLALALGLAAVAAARGERSWALWLAGVGGATAAVFAGWVVIAVAVALLAALAIWLVAALAG